MKITFGTLLFTMFACALLVSPTEAARPTCAQQSKICYRIGSNPGCLDAARIAKCKQTCVWTGTDGKQHPSEGDCRKE